MNKPIIFLIAGYSGSGKTEVANYLTIKYGIPYLQSYTTRPKRHNDEVGHKFVTDQEFDELISNNEVLALTKWGEYRYCCVEKDLSGIDSYVIDEAGIDYIMDKFKGKFFFVTVFLERDEDLRIDAVGKERVARDNGKFYKPKLFYDYIINSNQPLDKVFREADFILASTLLKFLDNKRF
jgi:guanylate kinase